jgi:hypothetical protein
VYPISERYEVLRTHGLLFEVETPHWLPSKVISTTALTERNIPNKRFLSIEFEPTKPQDRIYICKLRVLDDDVIAENKDVPAKNARFSVHTNDCAANRGE